MPPKRATACGHGGERSLRVVADVGLHRERLAARGLDLGGGRAGHACRAAWGSVSTVLANEHEVGAIARGAHAQWPGRCRGDAPVMTIVLPLRLVSLMVLSPGANGAITAFVRCGLADALLAQVAVDRLARVEAVFGHVHGAKRFERHWVHLDAAHVGAGGRPFGDIAALWRRASSHRPPSRSGCGRQRETGGSAAAARTRHGCTPVAVAQPVGQRLTLRRGRAARGSGRSTSFTPSDRPRPRRRAASAFVWRSKRERLRRGQARASRTSCQCTLRRRVFCATTRAKRWPASACVLRASRPRPLPS